MDISKVKKYIKLVQETGVSELEIQEDKERIRITNTPAGSAVKSSHTENVSTPSIRTLPLQTGEMATTQMQHRSDDPNHHLVKSPMVGTVFLLSSPGSNPFVEVGQAVKNGEVICLIEAMKMFNRIEADKDGIIKARLVENEQPVEFGQPLFIIESNYLKDKEGGK